MNKGPGLLKRWKQAISRFIAFCLYGDQNPMEVTEARRIQSDPSKQAKAEEEATQAKARNSSFEH
jgi:hypothetical protein